MEGRVVAIVLGEGGKYIILPPWRHGLTQLMVRSLPIINDSWGNWIHAFWCISDVGTDYAIAHRYDAVNDALKED